MKRANGTGTVVKLSGNRRKPYVVRASARDEYNHIKQRALSYHATAREAQAALDQYNADKATGSAPQADKLSMTLGGIYNIWSDRKYAKAGQSSIRSYVASWKRMERLSAIKMRDITIDMLQAIIDDGEKTGLSKSSIKNDKLLMHALFRFSMERDIVMKDYSEFVQLPTVEAKHEKGTFTEAQIEQIEQMAQDGIPWADTVLMLCYTGFRIAEFLALTKESYHADGDYLQGGLKTEAGKNRIIPVHPRIKPYLMAWLKKEGNKLIFREDRKLTTNRYRAYEFKEIMESIGLPKATPHWCRHTFSSILHAAGVPDLEHKRLMGHANSNVTEHYTHTDIEQLRTAIMLLK